MKQEPNFNNLMDYFTKLANSSLGKNLMKSFNNIMKEMEKGQVENDSIYNKSIKPSVKPEPIEQAQNYCDHFTSNDGKTHKRYKYTHLTENTKLHKTTVVTDNEEGDDAVKDIYIRIDGKFTGAEDILNQLSPVLDDELFSARVVPEKDEPIFNSCLITYNGENKNRFCTDNEGEIISYCYVEMSYDEETDRFIGKSTISSSYGRKVEMNIYYNEFAKCFKPLDKKSNDILMNILGEDIKQSQDKKTVSEYPCENNPTMLDNLTEPCDECINCKGFKECWMIPEIENNEDEECNECECECHDETCDTCFCTHEDEYNGMPVKPVKSIAESIYDEINVNSKREKLTELAIDSTLTCLNRGLYTPISSTVNKGEYDKISISVKDICKVSEGNEFGPLPMTFLSDIDVTKYSDELEHFCGFKGLTFNYKDNYYDTVVCKLI